MIEETIVGSSCNINCISRSWMLTTKNISLPGDARARNSVLGAAVANSQLRPRSSLRTATLLT